MQYTRWGTSGLKISRIALGGMSFGDPSKRTAWALDDNAAEPVFRQAVELGIGHRPGPTPMRATCGAGATCEVLMLSLCIDRLPVAMRIGRPSRAAIDPLRMC